METTSYEINLDSGKCSLCGCASPTIQPGEVRTITCPVQIMFRAEEAVRAADIDYSAFDVEQIHVGAMMQLKGARPADVLFHGLRLPRDFAASAPEAQIRGGCLDTAKPGLHLMMTVKNKSDKPQRFAVKLVGRSM